MPQVTTGSPFLDGCLGGGLPGGGVVLVRGEPGAGSTEFAIGVLGDAIRAKPARSACFATALRSVPRLERETGQLIDDPKVAGSIQFRAVDARGSLEAVANLRAGDVLALESASALARVAGPVAFVDTIRALGDAAAHGGATVLLMHAPGTLAPTLEAIMVESVDAFFDFSWLSGGPTRRRVLKIEHIRGLVPLLENEQVPVLEIGLQKGTGVTVSRVKSVV